ECSRTSRILSPAGVPPGSRVMVTARPWARRDRASFSTWVLLPLPSRPSKVINFPRAGTSEMIAGDRSWREQSGSGLPAARRWPSDRLQADILIYGSICAVVVRFDNPEGEWAQVMG